MFELSVDREFCAAHAIAINGRMEPVHGHNWKVSAVITGEELDSNGLLYDFHQIERHIDAVIHPFHNADLNHVPPFNHVNPTAEQVAQHIAQALSARLPGSINVQRVTVSEAPGCRATYWMEK